MQRMSNITTPRKGTWRVSNIEAFENEKDFKKTDQIWRLLSKFAKIGYYIELYRLPMKF